MVEIFANIPERVKQGAELIFNAALKTHDAIKMTTMLNDYVNNCIDEEEREFINFYFNLRMEQMLNESNNVKR